MTTLHYRMSDVVSYPPTGCSSLDGFLQENGPFLWQSGTYRYVSIIDTLPLSRRAVLIAVPP